MVTPLMAAQHRARELLRQAIHMELHVDSEATYRALMLLEHRAGHTEQALEVFEDCRRMLESELGVVPGTETLDLLGLIEDRPSGANRRGQLLSGEMLAVPDDEPLLSREVELAEVLALLSQGRRLLLQASAGWARPGWPGKSPGRLCSRAEPLPGWRWAATPRR